MFTVDFHNMSYTIGMIYLLTELRSPDFSGSLIFAKKPYANDYFNGAATCYVLSVSVSPHKFRLPPRFC
jgi:hypothetical protein